MADPLNHIEENSFGFLINGLLVTRILSSHIKPERIAGIYTIAVISISARTPRLDRNCCFNSSPSERVVILKGQNRGFERLRNFRIGGIPPFCLRQASGIELLKCGEKKRTNSRLKSQYSCEFQCSPELPVVLGTHMRGGRMVSIRKPSTGSALDQKDEFCARKQAKGLISR